MKQETILAILELEGETFNANPDELKVHIITGTGREYTGTLEFIEDKSVVVLKGDPQHIFLSTLCIESLDVEGKVQ
jgi:hypothetical protein